MVYTTNCTGTPVIDQSNILESDTEFFSTKLSYAYARKFIPTSRCLSSISLKLKKVAAGGSVTVQICTDNNGFPNFPSGVLGEFTRESEILSVYSEINFPLNIELGDLNPIWIVITSNYDPLEQDLNPLVDVANKYETLSNNFAFKSGNLDWSYVGWNPVFKTFKQTYGTETPKYNCINNVCVQDNINGTLTECTTPCGSSSSENNLAIYAVIGFGALLLYLSTRKK